MDGLRIAQTDLVKDFAARLEMKRPGDKIRLTFFRFDELREMQFTLGGRAPQNYKIVALDNPSKQQKRLYQSYFGAELK